MTTYVLLLITFVLLFAYWLLLHRLANNARVRRSEYEMAAARFAASIGAMNIQIGREMLPAVRRATEAINEWGRVWKESA